MDHGSFSGLTVQDNPGLDYWSYHKDPLPAQSGCVVGVSAAARVGELGRVLEFAHRTHQVALEEGNITLSADTPAVADFTRTRKVSVKILFTVCAGNNVCNPTFLEAL